MPERDILVAMAAIDPAAIVRNWRALSGGKAIVVSTPFLAPEIVHSFGMLPVHAESHGEIRSFLEVADGWIVSERLTGIPFPAGKPVFRIPGEWPRPDIESALDLLESLAEWAASVSGRAYSEGKLQHSIAAYRERAAGVRLLASSLSVTEESGLKDKLVRCGNWLPVETHILLIARFRPVSGQPDGGTEEVGEQDPLLYLARTTARIPQDG